MLLAPNCTNFTCHILTHRTELCNDIFHFSPKTTLNYKSIIRSRHGKMEINRWHADR